MLDSSHPSTQRYPRTYGSKPRSNWLLLLPILGCTAPAAFAQLTTADILGTVTDTTGAVIPNANVTVVNLGTHQTRTDKTNSSGDFQVTLLPVGHYSITVKASGFKTTTTPDLAVEAGDRARADEKLETGGESETVTVEATTPLLQADNATVSSTVTEKAVQDLPLNGRNFVQLVQLVPGANDGPGNGLTSGGRPDDRRTTASFSVNGQDDTLNNYIIDGADDNERIIGTIGVRPNVEGIQEITVETNSYSAEAGRTAGGVVNIITRSGTNAFHGSAYEFFRNDILNARNVLQTTGRKPELRQNQFGGSIGGPIIKDRTFFFADYEGFRLVSGLTYISTVPTLAEYNNINSLNGGSPGQLIASSTDGTAAYCATAAPNPATGSCIDPVALNYLKLFPAPNTNLGGITNNFVLSPNRTQFSNTVDAKIDHHFNSNNLLFGRYTYNKVTSFTPAGLGTVNGLQISGGRYNFSGPATDVANQFGFGFTHIFSSNLLLDLRATYTRINNVSDPLNFGLGADTAVGFGPNMNFSPLADFLTPIAFGGYPDVGDGAYVPLQDIDNTFQYSGAVSYNIGSHSIKVGGGLIRRQARNVQSSYAAGQYGFGLQNDSCNGPYNAAGVCPGANGASQAQIQINNLASSLVGAFTSEGRNNDITPPDYRSWEPSAFALDSWKVTPKLTVLYGVRYDIFTPYTEAHNRISNFDFYQAAQAAGDATTALKVAGVNGVDGHAGIKVDYSNVAPRVGFSFTPYEGTVLRGGYGLSFFPGNYTSNADLKNAPFVSVYSPNCGVSDAALAISTSQGVPFSSFNSHCNPANVVNQPNDSTHTFDAGLPLPTPQTINSNALSFVAEDPKFRSALIQQFNLQVEQQVGPNVFTIGYVGNIGQHLPETINNINSPAPGNSVANPALGAYKLSGTLPNLGGVGWLQSEGVSNYNSLQTSLQRRFTNGLAFDANYTWAKGLSDTVGFSEEGQQGWSNADPTRIRQIDYGITDNDIQNRFALSLNYELQYGKNFSGVKKAVLHGWEINSIAEWQTGKPISITNGGGNYGGPQGNRATPNNGGGNDRPNKIGNAGNPHTLHEWFNTANYCGAPYGPGANPDHPNAQCTVAQSQPLGTIGSAKRNSEFGPHYRHVDLSLFKDFPVTERVNAQFRAECFNISNTPNFYIPNANASNYQVGSSTFGQVTNYDPNYTPREFQFALKMQF